MPRAQQTAAPDPDFKPPANLVIEIAGHVLDIRKALPVRMDTWNLLRAQGVDPMRMARVAKKEELELEPLQTISRAVIRRACKLQGVLKEGLTDDEIDACLTMKQVTLIALETLSMEGGEPADRPTSSASSALPNGGAGDQEILSTSPIVN